MNESFKSYFHELMERHLITKEQQEKLIEKYLKEKPVDLWTVGIHIGSLTKDICLIEYFKLLSEGKGTEAMKFISMEHFGMVENELLKK